MTRLVAAPARVPFLLALALLAVMAGAGSAQASPEKVGPPSRVDALGDSITRGFDSQGPGCVAFQDCQSNNWATGSNTSVNSYFNRVKALNPSVVVANTLRTNEAVTGAKAADLNGQAQQAVANHADVVLILIGANDVCTSSETTMTSVADFRTRYQAGLETLRTGLPDARILVSSIPNIFNLWNVAKNNFSAQITWGLAGICQSMLASPTSTTAANVARRARVQQRNIDFNTQISQLCAQYIHCHYDGGAAYNLPFTLSDLSTLDYFHPNTNGQTKAAATAWTSGPNYLDTTAPDTTISRDHPAAGVDDWYGEDVQVSVSATDP